jgi:methionine sulfoxide reductase heme-binding subunit
MTPPVWTTSRASGLAALLTASLAITCGLLMALRVPALRRRAPELRAAHQALANATFALIGVHALALLLDPVLKPGVAGVLVPFAGPYRPVATALGQLAAYGMLALGATFYVRRSIGAARWRSAHRWLPAFWLLAVVHGLLAGTDTTTTWALAALAAPLAAAAALLVTRLATQDRVGAPSGSAASAASRSASLNSGSSRFPAR